VSELPASRGASPGAALPELALVVAADADGGIGKAGALPWRLSREMAFFKKLTSEASPGRKNAVIMGRKTFESIAPKFRPLRDRINVVLSRDAEYRPDGALRAQSLDEALALLGQHRELDRTFVIGGGEIYRLALAHERCARIHLTRVHAHFDCDTHLPPLDDRFQRTTQDGPHAEGELTYTFETYERR
jgi:dihydrofolate reductase